MAPYPQPTAPGEEPTAPGSLKAPDTHSIKLDTLEPQRKGGENFPLTTNQGYASPTIKTRYAPAAAGQRCWKILSYVRKLPTLTMNAFPSVSFMLAVPPHTAISSLTKA